MSNTENLGFNKWGKVLKGTEDWHHVAAGIFGGWEWDEFQCYYSPSARRYFYLGASGCSCYGFDDAIDGPGDFENGSREDAQRAAKSFLDNLYSGSDRTGHEAHELKKDLRDFMEPRA